MVLFYLSVTVISPVVQQPKRSTPLNNSLKCAVHRVHYPSTGYPVRPDWTVMEATEPALGITGLTGSLRRVLTPWALPFQRLRLRNSYNELTAPYFTIVQHIKPLDNALPTVSHLLLRMWLDQALL